MAQLTFIGATRQVTGSCYLLQTKASTVLMECGLYQGNHQDEQQNEQPFSFPVDQIDCVVISHTHLDHCGLLPRLVKEGYRGPIYMTDATHDLMKVMLTDAAFLGMRETEWKNRQRQRAGKPLLEPLYTQDDVDLVMGLREVVHFESHKAITGDITLTYHDAGHILGSAIVELFIKEKKANKTLVFSGDLGNSQTPLMNDPAIIKHADVLLMESTYGDRHHRTLADTLDEFHLALDEAADTGGNVLIPSFAVGRTQEVLFWLGKFHREGSLKQQLVFLDSPMAITASDIYFKHLHLFNDEDAQAFRQAVKHSWNDWLPQLKCTDTTEESMQINNIAGGAIIIAGSGMCTGGRITHHLKNNLWRNNAHVVIVGFQARETRGRKLVDGAKSVSIFDKEVKVNAKIHTLGGFSAHADQAQLLKWASHFKSKPELHLIHGELDQMLELQKQFNTAQHWFANIPRPGESIGF